MTERTPVVSLTKDRAEPRMTAVSLPWRWPPLATCTFSSFDPLLSETLQWSPARPSEGTSACKETAVVGRELNLSPVRCHCQAQGPPNSLYFSVLSLTPGPAASHWNWERSRNLDEGQASGVQGFQPLEAQMETTNWSTLHVETEVPRALNLR